MTTEESAEKLEAAYAEYVKRQSREAHPDGKVDQGGRWYPSSAEWQDCCDSIRTPSRSFPWSLMTHCRTADHIARLFGVDAGELKALVRSRKECKPARREGGDHYYKAVRLHEDGTMTSLYPKSPFTYEIGVTVHDLPHQEHNGGVYVYTSVEDARLLARDTYHLDDSEFVVLRCRCEGSYCRYPGGGWPMPDKLAFSNVTPLEVVE